MLAQLFDSTRRDLKRAQPLVAQTNALEPRFQALNDEALRAVTADFRKRLADGEALDALLPEAFAAVREAAKRTLGQRHYDVQLLGGTMLHEGRIAEMKTGEGKTLVATLPLYLNAISGRGCHLVTVNDYLAKRDAQWMGPVYRKLGLTVGCIQGQAPGKYMPSYVFEPDSSPDDPDWPHMREVERGEAYACDITYGTNAEFGFDYLRDNMAMAKDRLVQRELHYAIVDEVDSILIDEARTPLIISGPGSKPSELYVRVDQLIRQMTADVDYVVDERAKNAIFTDDGIGKLERFFGGLLSDPDNLEQLHHAQAALRAHAVYHRDVDYVVENGEVIIVDEFTGRKMYGRRYSEGLHQAIEAKEGVKVERESQTLATITYQNFFRLYHKLAGMTGTAKTEEQEFIKIYNMPVAVTPTNRPMVRKDDADYVYRSTEAKLRGIIAEIVQCLSRGQPTLVGTRSVEMSERLSARLNAEMLQLFAQLELTHDRLHELERYNEAQQRETKRVLDDRLAVAKREQRHIETALEKTEISQTRELIAKPEEIERMERRLRKVSKLVEQLELAVSKLTSTEGLNAGDRRRIADLVTYAPLETYPQERLPGLMHALDLDPDARTPDNVRRLAKLIGLDPTQPGRLRDILDEGLPHQVLNAKHHEKEAHIIEHAGERGTVTIATNMAGRGVDIKLGEGVKELGGLHIIGTERHEARRIDNQLRGRSGRQGDAGSSRFYVSFDDELWRLYGVERYDFMLGGWGECEPVESKLVSRAIENAQKKVEQYYFGIRQEVLKYDDVMNEQRALVYQQRRLILDGHDLSESIRGYIESLVREHVLEYANPEFPEEDRRYELLHQDLKEVCPQLEATLDLEQLRAAEDPVAFCTEAMLAAYAAREAEVGSDTMRDLERMVALWVVNTRWVEHLDAMDYLRDGIHLRGHMGIDPKIAYINEAHTYWQGLVKRIQEDIVRYAFRVNIEKGGEGGAAARREEPPPAGPNGDGKQRPQDGGGPDKRDGRDDKGKGPSGPSIPRMHRIAEGVPSAGRPAERIKERAQRTLGAAPRSDFLEGQSALDVGRKVGRNDPCPCGSGKKYKKCCLPKYG